MWPSKTEARDIVECKGTVNKKDENTCTLKADADKVHITVWDEDSGQDRQGKIFEGWLESDESKKIQSTTGFIVFSYKEAEDNRSYGDNHRTCKNGNTIRVP